MCKFLVLECSFFYHGKFLENYLKFHPHLVTNTDEISILQLLDKKKRATMADMSESMECLCYLMKTVGPKLDIPKAKVYFLPYLDDISKVYHW